MTKVGIIWICVFSALIMAAGASIMLGHTRVVADIAYLFPKNTADDLESIAIERTSQQLSRKIAFFVGHKNKDIALDVHERLQQKLISIDGLSVSGILNTEIQNLTKLYEPAIGALASSADYQTLKRGDGDLLVQRSLASLYLPGSSVNSALLVRDPLGLYQGFLSELSHGSGNGGIRGQDGFYYIPLAASLVDQDPDALEKSRILDDVNDQVSALTDTVSNLKIHYIGAPLYGRRIAEISKFEATKITAIALIGIIFLLLFIFRSFRPILGALLVIGTGVITGAAATVLFFGTVHLIAVAFGSSLIGVVVDYAIHYYSARRGDENGMQTATRIRSGLFLGAGTSLLGFLALAFADVEVLRQIAIYSAFGVAGAGACVLILVPLPAFLCQGGGFKDPSGSWRHFHYSVVTPRWFVLIGLTTIVMAIVIVMEIPKPVDDVQALRVQTPKLSEMEAQITKAGNATMATILLVKGGNSEEILQREEKLKEHFAPLVAQKSVEDLWGVSSIIPSIKRQEEVRVLGAALLASEKAKALLGLIPTLQMQSQPLVLSSDIWASLPSEIQDLQIQSDGTDAQAHMMILRGIKSGTDIAAMTEFPWVSVIDATENYTNALAQMRQKATYALLAGILVISLLFAAKFGFFKGIRVMLVPTCAAFSALVISALLGIEITFFSVMACFLVFALGADYSLFQLAAQNDDKDRAYLAVSSSALSTILVFGLLAFSAIPVLQTMGSVVVLGVIIAWLLAPLAAPVLKEKYSD